MINHRADTLLLLLILHLLSCINQPVSLVCCWMVESSCERILKWNFKLEAMAPDPLDDARP